MSRPDGIDATSARKSHGAIVVLEISCACILSWSNYPFHFPSSSCSLRKDHSTAQYTGRPSSTMDHPSYTMPEGVHAISPERLDLRVDSEIDSALLNPRPISDEKNVWFFWHSGFGKMHGYTQRNVRAWYRRFSKQGWVIRVLNRVPGSSLNVANFLDITDPKTFPRAFIDGTIGGDHAPQHTSDLVCTICSSLLRLTWTTR